MEKQIYCEWFYRQEKEMEEDRDPEEYISFPCDVCLGQLTCVYYRINKKLREK